MSPLLIGPAAQALPQLPAAQPREVEIQPAHFLPSRIMATISSVVTPRSMPFDLEWGDAGRRRPQSDVQKRCEVLPGFRVCIGPHGLIHKTLIPKSNSKCRFQRG